MQTQIRALNASGTEVGLRASEGGILASLPYYVLWTAKGYGHQAMNTAAIAALVVRPSTVAMVTLRNNSANKVLVIERAFAHNLVGVAGSSYGIWLCVHPEGMAAVTDDITVRNSTNGGAAGGSETSFDIEATVVADGWFPWSDSGHAVTVTVPGGQVEAKVNGRIIIPSTAAISLQVVADATGATFTSGFHWFEVPTSELLNS